MVVYECKLCNYTTIRKNQYQRHLTTKKHITNSEIYGTNEDNNFISSGNNFIEPHKKTFLCNCGKKFTREDNFIRHCKYYCQNKTEKKNICKFCGKYYSTTYNLNKHLKKCKKKDSEEDLSLKDYKKLFDCLYKELVNSKNELVAEKDKRIEEKENSKNEILTLMKENNNINTQLLLKQQDNLINAIKEGNIGCNVYNQTNNNMTNTNYVLQFYNYSEADSMDKIKDKFKMTRDEFLKASLTKGYRGALLDKADKVIIQPYLEAQSKRPIHTVDTARKKALYKDDNHDKWTFNPKTTLSHCFNEFHKSALEHQDQTIKENPNWVIESFEDNLYKQTYFIPAEMKEKESIFRDIKNHIYKETKVKRDIMNEEFLKITENENENGNENYKEENLLNYQNIFGIDI